jgi:phosphotransferase system HPr-like phosphotransfer protein
VSADRPLEEIIGERSFAVLLQTAAQPLFRLCNTLAGRTPKSWGKRHFYQLSIEADSLESFLDDYGARFNRTYTLVRELVASLRWFALAGFSLSHVEGRLESYGVGPCMEASEFERLRGQIERARLLVGACLERLASKLRDEAKLLGLHWDEESFPENNLGGGMPRHRLPRNVGQEDLLEERERIAELAAKYEAACLMLQEQRVRPIEEARARAELLRNVCSETQARVYEATVHNLQSSYDTFVKNTVAEGRDERLTRLRGHTSVALHLLEAVTFLTHFVERHESEGRSEAADLTLARLIDRSEVERTILNDLLVGAVLVLERGRGLAGEVLADYTNVQELAIELPSNVRLHARPASLIVNIVAHHGTPVELEVCGKRCNAGSILELLVTLGSCPDVHRLTFRGDEHPLRDIRALFESGLGEDGLERLPAELSYLRGA